MDRYDKILLNSLNSSLQIRRVLGNSADSRPLILYELLLTSYKFAKSEYDKGDKTFKDKYLQVEKLLEELIYQCDDICLYEIYNKKKNGETLERSR